MGGGRQRPAFVVAAMTFTENWFSSWSCIRLARLASVTAGVPGLVVEVGCWEGKSTVALANAVAPATVVAIDTWAGSPGDPSEILATERDVYATFTENIRALTAGNVAPQRMGWRDWFEQNTSKIRFLHIDGPHTYDEVRDNIIAALPFMSPGSIICGDDAHHPPVNDAVFETLGDIPTTATLWWKRIGVT